MMKVALIYGGEGCERAVSENGFGFIFPILKREFDTLAVYIDKDGRWLTGGGRVYPTEGGLYCPDSGDLHPVDCAFPLLHGKLGEDGVIQGALRTARIPYIGCDGPTGAVCRDKAIVKAVAERLSIPTLPFITLGRGEDIPSLDYPLFLKPTCLGSSLGASAVMDESQLPSAIKSAFAVCDRVIIEPCLTDKRELECGYFATKGKEIFTNVGEILTEGFYDYDKKYGEAGVRALPNAKVDQKTNDRIKEYSRTLVKALGVRQISRIDFFLSGEEIYFNEINTMPGFTQESLYHKMLSAEGITLPDLLSRLVLDAYDRGI